jgi:hypothetical protein
MSLATIFSQHFLFTVPTNGFSVLFIAYVVFFALLILGATAILTFVKGVDRKIYIKYVYPFFTFGILGFLHLAARYEGLAWLSTRFTLLLIFTALIVWVAIIFIKMVRNMPKVSKERRAEEKFKKYLPKKKK